MHKADEQHPLPPTVSNWKYHRVWRSKRVWRKENTLQQIEVSSAITGKPNTDKKFKSPIPSATSYSTEDDMSRMGINIASQRLNGGVNPSAASMSSPTLLSVEGRKRPPFRTIRLLLLVIKRSYPLKPQSQFIWYNFIASNLTLKFLNDLDSLNN